MSGHTFLIEVGADLAHRGRKFAKAVEDDNDTKQVSYNYCIMRRSAGNGFSKDPGVERSRYSHGVSSRGAAGRSSH